MKNNNRLSTELRAVLIRLVRKLRKLSPSENSLSQSERSVLVLLDQHDKLLSSELALIEKMTPQSMGQVLNHLVDLELISKNSSINDKRKVIISLSVKGKEAIQKVRNERDEWLNEAISKTCTEKERIILMEAIKPLTKLVDFESDKG